MPTPTPVTAKLTPPIIPLNNPTLKPLNPPFLAPIIGAAIIVDTPPISPLPILFRPDEVPARASFGLRVENTEFYLSPTSDILLISD